MRTFLRMSFVLLVLASFASLSYAAGAPADVTVVPHRETFLLVPLHLHVLSSTEHEEVNCKLTDDDLKRISTKINGIWHKAGIHFVIAPVLHEKAVNVETIQKKPDSAAPGKKQLFEIRDIAPVQTRDLPGLHVYYIHQFSPNGVYVGRRTCFVKETAVLRAVPGGIDEPLPRVSAHELGHAMGLSHRQDTTNLMASGTTGTLINEAEVKTVRERVAKQDGTMTFAEYEARLQEAEKTGHHDVAAAMKSELEKLPE